MKRSRYLVGACSAALLFSWAGAGLAQQGSEQQNPRSQNQQNQQTNQDKHNRQEQQSRQQASRNKQDGREQTQMDRRQAHGSRAVIESAGQPTNVLVVGNVTDARNVTLAGTAGDKHRLLKVQPKGGKEVVVDIGVPQSTSGMNFSKGDRIIAMGKPARINGRPVLFAANVAEMQRVNLSSGDRKQQSAQQQSSQQQQSGQQQTARQQSDGYDAVIYLFETDNFAEDQYGAYDEDFAWSTNDSTYGTWNDTATAWENSERAHYDMFGYDDAGEAGWWDW